MHELYAWQEGSCVNRKSKDLAAANPTLKTPTSGRQLVEISDSQRAQEHLHVAAKAQVQSFTVTVSLLRHHPRPSLLRTPPQETRRSRSSTSSLKRHPRPCRPRSHLFCSPHPPPPPPPASPAQHNGNTAESISRFLDEQFLAAFGAPLLKKDGDPDSRKRKLW